MDGHQNIYYALGILAYAMAKADGEVQDAERSKLVEIVKKELDHDINFEYAEIIFQLLERDHAGFEKTYAWAIAEFQKGRHYFTPQLKQKSLNIIINIAKAFNSVSKQEEKLIDRFERDLKNLGSPHSIK